MHPGGVEARPGRGQEDLSAKKIEADQFPSSSIGRCAALLRRMLKVRVLLGERKIKVWLCQVRRGKAAFGSFSMPFSSIR